MIFSLATAIIIINQLSRERTSSLRTSVVPFLINKIPPFPRTFQSRFFSKPITDPDLCCSAIKFAAILDARVKKNLLEDGEGGEKRGRKSKVQRICLRGRGWRGRIESRRLVTKATMGTESNRKLIMAVSSVSPN